MIIFSVLTLFLILKLIKINKDRDLESADIINQIRQHLVMRINEWLNHEGMIPERELVSLCRKYETHFSGKFKIDVDVHAGCFLITLTHKWMKHEISGYMTPPRFNLENNIPYKVK